MLMIWLLGHAALFVIIVGSVPLAAVASQRIALHPASHMQITPVRVRSGRRGLS